MAKKNTKSTLPSMGQAFYQTYYKLGQGDASVDFKSQYEAELKTSEIFNVGVQQMIGLLSVGKNEYMKDFESKANDLLKNVNTETPLGEGLYDTTFDFTQSLKDELKQIGNKTDKESEKARNKIYNKLNRVNNTLDALETDLIDMASLVKYNQISKDATDAKYISAITEIINKESNKVSHQWVGGDVKFTVKTEDFGNVEIMASQIRSKILPKSVKGEKFIYDIGANAYTAGTKKFGVFDFQLTADSIKDNALSSEADFADLANRRLRGHEMSYKQALATSDIIHNALDKVRTAGPDGQMNTEDDQIVFKNKAITVGSKVGKEDFATEANKLILVEALTNIESDNFNFELARQSAAEYFASQSQMRFDDGKSAYEKSLEDVNSQKTKTSFGYTYQKDFFGGEDKQQSPVVAQNVFNAIRDGRKTFEGMQGVYAKVTRKKDNKVFYILYDDMRQYTRDMEDGKLSYNEKEWQKTFGSDSKFIQPGGPRYMSPERVRDIEGATPSVSGSMG